MAFQIRRHLFRLIVIGTGAFVLGACSGGTASTPSPQVSASATGTPTEVSPSGDVPDNAVFVTYASQDSGYSIQYVEGWTVTPGTAGSVAITDIDSAELVDVLPLPPGDLMQYVATTDEAQLKTQVQDYQRTGLDTLPVHNQSIIRLTYASTSAPDSVTGKRRASTSQRYYIPSPKQKVAILTLTTPINVDNVDAFKQILESFTWQ